MNDGDIITLKGRDGKTYSCIWKSSAPSGAKKEVFFPADMSYAIALFKETPDATTMNRLVALIDTYRPQLFRSSNSNANAYWEKIFCWPYEIVKGGGKIGIVMKVYPSNFFFRENHTVISKGQEKKGGWFTDPYHRFYHVPPAESGDWKNVFENALLLARGIRKLHAMGLAHSDLSGNNVLVDPTTRSTLIIDNDGLVVPGRFDAEVEGTPEYIAPEVIASRGKAKAQRYKPSQETDKHALAVLIYQLLLCRHPLKGKNRFADDDENSREMGSDALFIENPRDRSSRFDAKWVREGQLPKKHPYLFPWLDIDKIPYTILGPYLSDLVERAFVTALHPTSKQKRPTAAEWEFALERTIELLHPCNNPKCIAKWFVLDETNRKTCPFCGSRIKDPIPIIKFVKINRDGSIGYEESVVSSLEKGRIIVPHRLVLWDNGKGGHSKIFPVHVQNNLPPRENRTAIQRQAVAEIVQGKSKNGVFGLFLIPRDASRMFVSLNGANPQRFTGNNIRLVNGLRIQLDGPSSKILEIEIVK